MINYFQIYFGTTLKYEYIARTIKALWQAPTGSPIAVNWIELNQGRQIILIAHSICRLRVDTAAKHMIAQKSGCIGNVASIAGQILVSGSESDQTT